MSWALSPFVASFSLGDLNQQDRAAANDVLDFVATAQRHAFAAQIIGSSIAIPAFATRCGLLLTLMVVTALAIVLIVQRRGCGQFLNVPLGFRVLGLDRKSTRLNSSH